MLIEIAHTEFAVGRQKRALNHKIQQHVFKASKIWPTINLKRAIILGCILSLWVVYTKKLF